MSDFEDPEAQRILLLLEAADSPQGARTALDALARFAEERIDSDDLRTLQTFAESVAMRFPEVS